MAHIHENSVRARADELIPIVSDWSNRTQGAPDLNDSMSINEFNAALCRAGIVVMVSFGSPVIEWSGQQQGQKKTSPSRRRGMLLQPILCPRGT